MPTVATQSKIIRCKIAPGHWAFNEWSPDDCTIQDNGYGIYYVYDNNLMVTVAYSENYPALTRWLSRQG